MKTGAVLMGFSKAERERRDEAMRQVMEVNDLKALVLMGDTNVGNDIYGDFRYCADNRIIFYRQVAVLFPASAPVLFAGSAIQRQAASRNSSISDCRQSDNLPADIGNLLNERGVSSGKVGVNFDVLPVSWLNYLRNELPGVDWIGTHNQVLAVRFRRSTEEADLLRKCGPLARL